MHRFVYFFVIVIFYSLLVPGVVRADNDLEVAGWIPYWRAEQGIKDAQKHLDSIDTVYPFAFTIKEDGDIKDLAKLKGRTWKKFFALAREKDIEIIPTIMTSDGALVHTLLSDEDRRKEHIAHIVRMVERGKYAGVGIDYEGKKSRTIDYFSLFLKELKEELDEKLLVCTIEARTPPDSLYREVPAVIEYANDYEAIGTYCDRIDIMAYDQQRADLKLNSERAGEPYMPVADTAWVEKVVELAIETLPKEKIMLGIPTYGNHYEITVAPDWYRDYTRIGALNVPHILDLAKEYKVKPSRNKAGEMVITYLHKDSKVKFPKHLTVSKTHSGNKVAAQALAYANKTGKEVTFRYASYSDVGAMEEKINLAEEYNLRGVALFKIDGEEDQKVWKILKE